jgi:NAD(P)-dependent dehydrogenase (short-subunit alcohol dehydrogenase family)
MTASEQERAVLITGASSGIGRSATLRLADNGWQVFAGVRDRLDAPQRPGVHPVELDVTSQDSIEGAARILEQEAQGRLDGLVNNAGIPVTGAVETIPVADFRRLIETNLIGQFAVTQAMLPAIRRAQGRIVFISSVGGRVAFPYASAYHAAKFGVEGLAESLRAEMTDLGVDVSVVEPGSMATEIWGKGREHLAAVRDSLTPEQEAVYGEELAGFDQRLASADESAEDPEAVAEVIEDALTDSRPDERYVVGRGAGALTAIEPLLPAAIADRVKRRLAASG